jgi:Zn-dependent protease
MDTPFPWPPSWATLFLLPSLLIAFTVHELSHAVVAFLLGDTSQVERKRLSFNPLRHISWLGMIAFLLVGFGWAKPVMVDWTRFRIKNRAFGMFLVSIAGASANLLVGIMAFVGMLGAAAVAWGVNGVDPAEALFFLLTHKPGPDALGVAIALSTYVLYVNVVLAFFNLLPLPPLDGFQALMSLIGMIRGVLKGGRSSSSARAADTTSGEAQPQSPAWIHFGIALAYQKAGELEEAIARYRQAIAHDAQFGLAYYNLGLAYLAKSHYPLASSSFKAALKARGDVGIQVEASRRLRELAQAEQHPDLAAPPIPAPLEPGSQAEGAAAGGAPLDPAFVRRLWLRLALGGALAILLGAAAWLFVTAVLLSAMG